MAARNRPPSGKRGGEPIRRPVGRGRAALPLAFALALFSLCRTGAAQTPPSSIPGAAEPGRPELKAPVPPAPPAILELDIRVPGGVKPSDEVLKQSFRLRRIELDGVTAYAGDELAGIYRDSIGKAITFGEFYRIAEAIQARYHRDGYFLSFAFIPPQTIRDGTVRISVIEGFVQSIRIIGVDGRLKRTIAAVVAPVTGIRPLRLGVLERQLLIAGRLAGIRTTGILRRHETIRGASVLVVRAKYTPFNVGADINSRGSEFTGPWRYGAQISANSMAGIGERLLAGVTLARNIDELRAFNAAYTQPIGVNGLVLTASLRTTRSNPGFSLAQFDTSTRSITGDLDLSYPLVLRRGDQVTLGAGLTYLDTGVDLLGGKFSRDRIRTARAWVQYGQVGFLGGRNSFSLEMIQGLAVLAATDPDRKETSRDDAEPEFFRATMEAAHIRALTPRVDLKIRATGQFAPDPLPASQEFALGGARYGRAFNSGEQTGERGIALSIESGYTTGALHELIPRGRAYGFVDSGVLWNDQTAASTGGRSWLGSFGAGFSLEFVNNLDLRLEYAVPFGHTPSNDRNRNGRLFVFLTKRF